MSVCAGVSACVRACARACVRSFVRSCMHERMPALCSGSVRVRRNSGRGAGNVNVTLTCAK